MRYLLFIFLILPCAGFAQEQSEYEETIARFIKFYNNYQSDSIKKMWPAETNPQALENMWSKKELDKLHKDYGMILSYQYLGIDTTDESAGLVVFKTRFTGAGVGWKTTSMTIDKGYLGTFRFITSSKGIEQMLKGSN
jgi:hypothetical protein